MIQFQSESESEPKGRRPMSQLEDTQAESEFSLSQTFCSIQAFVDWVKPTHTGEDNLLQLGDQLKC